MIQQKHLSIVAKAWVCLLALSLLLVVSACGGSDTSTAASTPTAAPTTAAPTDTPTPTPTTAAPTDTPTAAPTSGGLSVTLDHEAFAPTSLTVKVGDKVTWTNKDVEAHTVTADQGAFDSGVVAVGQSFSFTFTKAGTYSYHCDIHPTMRATIIVK